MERLRANDFDKLYDLIERSFPSDEYRPYEEQKALFDNPIYAVFAQYDGKALAAFIAAWEFEEFVFLEHFAVEPSKRNGGLGGAFLTEVVEQFQKPVCLEVELPDTELAARRIRFYERKQFVLNGYDYFQPPISKGRNPLPLRVMSYRSPLNAQAFLNVRDLLYDKVYRYSPTK